MEVRRRTTVPEGFFPATAMPDRDWWAALWPDPEGTLHDLGVRSGMTVIDLCCGDGYFTAPLAMIVSGRVYALDIDPQMLEQARVEVERQGASVAEWIRADARDIVTLIPELVDYVLIANTFHGVPDPTGLARAVADVLKPGGRFAVVNWHQIPRDHTMVLNQPRGPRTEMRMAPEQVRAVVEPAGFRLVRVVELPPYHYGAIFVRSEAQTKEQGKITDEKERAGGQDQPQGANPMAMGMEMARKMMAQMGKGGPNPVAMMQKMMSQMGGGQEGGAQMPRMMQMCMGMCAEMLATIERTIEIAAPATPELHRLFGDWLADRERAALDLLNRDGEPDAATLARSLGLGVESAAYLLARLARAGKVSLRAQVAQKSA